MKLSTVFAFLALILLTSTATFAAMEPLPAGMTTVPLAGITNDRNASVSYLKLILNGQAAVRGIYVETDVNADQGRQPASKQVYWLKGIESRHGVVLGKGQGVKAILLQGKIDSQDGRGSLVIKYLTNGMFMNYSECKVGLQRVSARNWKLVNAYNGQPINRIRVKTWFLGISTLANVCPDRTS